MWFKPKSFHKTKEWQALARKHKALEKKNKNWSCVDCQYSGWDLQSDHVLPVSKFWELRLLLQNLVLRCGVEDGNGCNQKKGAKITLSPKSIKLQIFYYAMKLIKNFVLVVLIVFFGRLIWIDVAFHPFESTVTSQILIEFLEIFLWILEWAAQMIDNLQRP